MNIPFLDLITPHKELQEELIGVVRNALLKGHFVGGAEVEAFEKEWASFCGTRYCAGVASGTDALRFALLAAGIGKGDTVVTVPNTFIATTEAISQTGANIAFVDIDEKTYNMDTQKLEAFLKTHGSAKAILPVHLYGQPCDMDAILELSKMHHAIVIEDSCQAHGAEYFTNRNCWVKAGSMSLAGAFSFYPGKNLGACGEAGAVVTNDPEMDRKIRMLRDHGQAQKYYHDFEGYNGRLDAIQAGILRVKLHHLPEWNNMRRKAAERYAELLSGIPDLILPHEPFWAKSIYHLFVIRTRNRDSLQSQLNAAGISCGLHYPIPLHLQKAYNQNGSKPGSYPIAERYAREILSLPMFPQLTPEDQIYIAAQIQLFYSSMRSSKGPSKSLHILRSRAS